MIANNDCEVAARVEIEPVEMDGDLFVLRMARPGARSMDVTLHRSQCHELIGEIVAALIVTQPAKRSTPQRSS